MTFRAVDLAGLERRRYSPIWIVGCLRPSGVQRLS